MSNVIEKINEMCESRLSELSANYDTVTKACNLCYEWRVNELPAMHKWKSCQSDCPMYNILGKMSVERSELMEVRDAINGVEDF